MDRLKVLQDGAIGDIDFAVPVTGSVDVVLIDQTSVAEFYLSVFFLDKTPVDKVCGSDLRLAGEDIAYCLCSLGLECLVLEFYLHPDRPPFRLPVTSCLVQSF